MLFTPLFSKSESVSAIMLKVLLALVPGIALYVWYFGPAILVSITLASITALGTEALMLKLRDRPVAPFLKDNSALLAVLKTTAGDSYRVKELTLSSSSSLGRCNDLLYPPSV